MGAIVEPMILPPQMTVETAEETKGLLTQWVTKELDNLTCSGVLVEKIDSSGLQILIAVHNYLQQEGKQLVTVQPSPRLREVLEYSGATKVLVVEEE